MKKLTILFLCLALISLACLEVSGSVVDPGINTEVATRSKITATSTAPAMTLTPPSSEGQEVCAKVIAATAENLRLDADPNARILTHLLHGDVVRVLDQSNADWWRVSFEGFEGFARSIYLEKVECVK